jgi:hypothetical protein
MDSGTVAVISKIFPISLAIMREVEQGSIRKPPRYTLKVSLKKISARAISPKKYKHRLEIGDSVACSVGH